MASQDILINWAPQETRVAIVENGAVQELHIERALERGLVGNVYLGKVARVLPGMQTRLHRHRPGARRLPARGRPATRRRNGTRRARRGAPPPPIERQVFEGQTLTVQVIKDPIGTKGARLSTQVVDRRAHAGVPAAGRPHRHLAEDRLARAARAAARAHAGAGGRGRRRQGRRLHPAHQCRGGQRRRAGRRHRLPAQDLGRHPRARASSQPAGHAAAPGPEPGRARAARPEQRIDADHPHRLADCSSSSCKRLRRDLHAAPRRPSWSTTTASGRSSTCSTSTTRSRARWRAASS